MRAAPRLTLWWQRELALGVSLLAAGALLLPLAVYWVGGHVFGEYGAEAGVWNLMLDVWTGLAQGSVLAWALVLSPYGVIQLVRLAWLTMRAKPNVTELTVSDAER
jgi:hypothetical protein